jgi:negative elongation factor A
MTVVQQVSGAGTAATTGAVQLPVGTTPSAPNQPKKGLSLTKEQMVEAQEMFRTSNKVTRPEKALILGFMAGSRDNPCQGQGDIINIRLSEHVDTVQTPEGIFRPMIVETYFQMNYGTGESRRITKMREKEPEIE